MTIDEIKAKAYADKQATIKEANKVFKNAPDYARIGPEGCIMKLEYDEGYDKWTYWRPAGLWGCDIHHHKGKFYSSVKEYPWIHNIEMVPATKEEYLQDNKGYV